MNLRLAFLLLFVSAFGAAQPRLVLAAARHDFGPIEPARAVSHRFTATNAGTSTLTISRLRPSCGCTSTVVGQQILAPGESTELEVAFNPAGMRGKVEKTVQVVSDDPARPIQLLTFQAEVLPEIRVSTEEVVFTGLSRRDRRKASVKLETGTGQPIVVRDVELSEAPWLGVATREVGDDLWVDFLLVARKLPPGKGSGIDTIALHVANPRPSVVNLTVRWALRHQ
jgi:hypothetical protein